MVSHGSWGPAERGHSRGEADDGSPSHPVGPWLDFFEEEKALSIPSRGGQMVGPSTPPGGLDPAIDGLTTDGSRDGQGPRLHRAGQTRLLNRGTGGCTLVSSQGPSTVVGL